MNEWLHALQRASERGRDAILVMIAAGKGSTPRDAGVKMVVDHDGVAGTIGGGELEFQAIGIARDMLGATNERRVQRFALGHDLGQVCGGAANVFFERVAPQADWVQALARWHEAGDGCVIVTPADDTLSGRMVVSATGSFGVLDNAVLEQKAIDAARAMLAERARPAELARLDRDYRVLLDPVRPTDMRVVLFGAGHVGQALARVLGVVSCEVTWVDSRPDQFPAEVPGNVRAVLSDQPGAIIAATPAGSYFITMTHSHALDFEVIERVLARDDFAFCGMIGSSTKRRSFEQGCAKKGLDPARLARLTCPVGIAGLSSKEPGTIAVAIAAQLLAERERRAAIENVRTPVAA